MSLNILACLRYSVGSFWTVEVPSDAISSSYRVSTDASLSNTRYVLDQERIGVRIGIR